MNADRDVLGTTFLLSRHFGKFPVAPLLRAMNQALPSESTVFFVTPIPKSLRTLLRDNARPVKKGFLHRRYWALDGLPHSDTLANIAEVAAVEEWHRLAVWMLAKDSQGTEILEAEDGNNYLWLADIMPEAGRQTILEAVGGVSNSIEGTRPLP